MPNYQAGLKRVMDLLGATLGLLLFSPLMFLIAMILRLSAGAPVLYQETRIGRHQTPFALYKFRSMKLDGDASSSTVAASDDPRVHALGRFLRGSHLDELPQLCNVLRGDMSLVGPRPYKPEHFDHLSDTEKRLIVSVRPGVTGTDALHFIAEDSALIGQNDPERLYLKFFLPEKARLQCLYVQSRSIGLDLRILAQTLAQWFSGRARRESIHSLHRLLPQNNLLPTNSSIKDQP